MPDAGCVCKMERAYPEGDYPSFSGCLFVAGNVAEVASLASSQKAAILLDKEGKVCLLKRVKQNFLPSLLNC